MKVIKLGGSTIKNYNDLQNAINFLSKKQEEDLIIIISAFDKLSQLLKDLVGNIILNPKNYINELNKLKLFFEKYNNKNTKNLLQKHLNDIENLFYAVSILEECSDKLLDNILSYGDIISAEIFYSEFNSNVVRLVDAKSLIVTDSNYGNANILFNDTIKNLKEIKYNKINIVAGFIGSDKVRNVTTLGFENSNLTAILFSIAVNSKQCQYITDTSGVYEIDPKIQESEFVKNINYDDALNLSKIGLKLFTEKQITLANKYKIQLSYFTINCPDKVSYVSNKKSTFNVMLLTKNNELIIYSNKIPFILNKLANISEIKFKEIRAIFDIFLTRILLQNVLNNEQILKIYRELS